MVGAHESAAGAMAAQSLRLGALPLGAGLVGAKIITKARAKLGAGVASTLQSVLDGVTGVTVDRLIVVCALHGLNPF